MRTWLAALYRCLGADVLKLRRTTALALAIFLPVLPPLLSLVFVLQSGNAGTPDGVSPVAWTILGILTLWAGFLIPLLAAIETSLLAGIEQHHGGWKQLLALPVPRTVVYAAKYVVAGVLMGIATVACCGYTMLTLWGLSRLRPDAGFDGPFLIWETLGLFTLVGAASLLLLSVHGFVAMRWSSFPLNVGLALTGLLSNAVLAESRWRFTFPWSLPPAIENLAAPMMLELGSRATPSDLVPVIPLALAGAAAVTLLGVWGLSRRDVL